MRLHRHALRVPLTACVSASVALSVTACGKKAEPAPAPAPTEPATPAPAATTPAVGEPGIATPAPAEVKPGTDTPDQPAVVAAPTEPSTPAPADPVDAPPPTEPSPGLPGWWAPLFVEGHVFTFDVKFHSKTLDIDRDPSLPSVYTEENKTAVMTCKVATVEKGEGTTQKSTVTCEGFDDVGTSGSIAGIWMTDGARVWIPSENDLPDELSMPAEPKEEKRTLGEGDEVEIVYTLAPGEVEGTWCSEAAFQMGDGGTTEVCFSKEKGPVSVSILTGSAAQDITVTMTLK